MAQARFTIASQHAAEFRALAKALREAGDRGKGLRSELRKRIAEAGKPVVAEVKAAVRTVNVTSEGVGARSIGIRQASPGAHGGGQAQRRALRAGKARTPKAAERALRRGGGLRESIAAATRLQITTKGVKIIVASSRLPPDQQHLPRHLDSEKGWRHPVFGNREVWATERGGPYFGSTIKKNATKFRAAILKAMEAVKNKIERT